MASSRKGSVRDDAVIVRGVRGTRSVVVRQLIRMWHCDGKRYVHLTDQVWLAVNVLTERIVRWLVGRHAMVTPAT